MSGMAQALRVVASLAYRILVDGRPACVHVNTSGSLGFVRDLGILLLCRVLGIRTILHLRFGRVPLLLDGYGYEGRLLRWALHQASETLCIDRKTYDAVVRVAGAQHTHLIPNFIEAYEPRFARNSRAVLFLGSVSPSKGVPELLQAWKGTSREGWTLRLVGPPSPSVDRLLRTEDMAQSVQQFGPVSHEEAMKQMYDAAILVLPSHSEGFPNVVLEAMVTGTPVIASAVGAIPEMLGEGGGLIVPAKDVPALQAALEVAMSDSDRRLEMATKAYAVVRERYSVDSVVSQYRARWVS